MDTDVVNVPAKLNTQLLDVKKRLFDRAGQILEGCAPNVTPKRMMTTAYLAIRKTPKLLECDIVSLCASISEAGQAGLEIGGVRGLCYLVPYKTTCQLIISYKGLIELCQRSGQVMSISANLVHKVDRFRVVGGTEERIEHEPNTDPKRSESPVTHVYAIFRLLNGGVMQECWTAADINDHKSQHSPGWQKPDSPWQKHWGIMARKTVIRSMINRGFIPMAVELLKVVARDEPIAAESWVESSVETTDTEKPAELPGSTQDTTDRFKVTTLPDDEQIALLRILKNETEKVSTMTKLDGILAKGATLSEDRSLDLELFVNLRRQAIRESRGTKSNK